MRARPLARAARTPKWQARVLARPRDQRGEAREEARGAHLDVSGAVAAWALQGEEHAAVEPGREVGEAVVRERGAQEVAEHGLAALAVVGRDGEHGVEVEVFDASLATRGQVHLCTVVVVELGSVRGGASCARRGGQGLGQGALGLVERVEVGLALCEESARAGHDASEDGLDLGGRGRGCLEEHLAAVSVRAVGTVEKQRVQMHVGTEVCAAALDGHERAAAWLGETRLAREPAVAALDLALRYPSQRQRQLVVEGQRAPEAKRKGEHPLARADVGKDPLGELAREHRHLSADAARAKAPAFAREGHYTREPTAVTAVVGAAIPEHATREGCAQLLGDEAWQGRACLLALGEEGLEVVSQDRVQRALARVSR